MTTNHCNHHVTTAPLAGKTALITGAASGLGLETALGLARLGADIIVVDRDQAGGESAAQRVRDARATAQAEFRHLDLASLAAIREFSQRFLEEARTIDILVNNAGLLPPLQRTTTVDGFELGFGVSVVGHYALTGLLLPSLQRSSEPRVVTISSIAHAGAKISFDDLSLANYYEASYAYGSAKLGALLFAFELGRRAQSVMPSLISVAAHPGISRTPIAKTWDAEGPRSLRDRVQNLAMKAVMRWLSQDAEQGAAPFILAATSADAKSGSFYGPGGFRQFRGEPQLVEPHRDALDPVLAARLWEVLENRTGIEFSWPPATT